MDVGDDSAGRMCKVARVWGPSLWGATLDLLLEPAGRASAVAQGRAQGALSLGYAEPSVRSDDRTKSISPPTVGAAS